jgi:hypothetical protein
VNESPAFNAEFVDCNVMGTDPIVARQSDRHRYEAVLRISEAIAACREPEDLATTLASEIGKFLHFDHLYFVVVKENSEEIEYLVWGKGPLPLPDLPIEEFPWWEAVRSRDPQHTADWDTEERYPRFKEWAKKMSYFVQKFAKQMQKKIDSISPAIMRGLTAWEWPGNIRELENFIERAVIVTRGKSLDAPLGELRKTNTVELPRAHDRKLERVVEERTDSQSDQTSVADEYERRQRDEIIRALTACKGRVGGADGAAARLGMNRTTFLSRMKKFGIYAKQYA